MMSLLVHGLPSSLGTVRMSCSHCGSEPGTAAGVTWVSGIRGGAEDE